MRVSSGAWLYDPASAAGHRVPRQRATFRYFLIRCTALIPRTRPAGRATAMARLPLAVRAAALVGTVLAFTFRLASLLAGQGFPLPEHRAEGAGVHRRIRADRRKPNVLSR
jgi:hypothetical protein